MNLLIHLNKQSGNGSVEGDPVSIGTTSIELVTPHVKGSFIQLTSGRSLRVTQTPSAIDALMSGATWSMLRGDE